MTDCDVLIVGGGPAGVSTALFAAAEDPKIVSRLMVIEKARYPREKICAGAVGGRADKALDEIGVRVDVPERRVRGLSVRSPLGLLVADREAPIGRVIRRKEFDAELAQQAKERGIRFMEGHGVRSLSRDGGGVTVTLDDGQELRARAVVGADGVGSVVRRAIGIRRKTFYAQAIEVDTPAAPDDPDPELLHFDVQDRSLRGYVWDFPTIVDGEPMVCRGVYELRGGLDPHGVDSDEAREGPSVKARLLRHLEERGIDAAGLRLKQFSERALSLHEPIAVPRTMLVGEAAGIEPVLGEGIAQAVLYGKTAGPYLAGCMRRGDYSFANWWNVFATARIGLDLRIRTRLASWIYDGTRPLAERFVTFSPDFADAGIHYFAGDRVPRMALLRAAWHLARAGVSGHPLQF